MSVSRLYVAVSLATIERQAGRYNVGLADYTSSAGRLGPGVVAKQSIFFCSFLNTMQSSSRIIGYDYIRAISILLVILFHFSSSFDIYSITGFHNIFYSVGHTGWGSVAVYMFLMLSGASLYLNYSDTLNVKNFYKKRWLSIY